MTPATAWVASGGKGALSFTANNTNRVEVADSGFFNAISQFSFSAWFNLRAYTGSIAGNAIFCRGQIAAFNNDINLMIDTSGTMFAQVNNGADGSSSFSLPSFYTLGTWAQVSLVYDGRGSTNDDRVKIYLNGSRMALSHTYTVPATTSTITSGNTFRFGQYLNTSNANEWAFNGFLDDITIYNTSLTASEVREIYRLGRGYGVFPEPDFDEGFAAAGFKAYWARRQHLIGSGVY
jgi:hypothetical protein